MRYYTLLAVLFSAVLFVGGCKKKDDPSRKDLLTSGNWKLTAWTSDPPVSFTGGAPATDQYAQLKSTDKDDLYIFTSDGKLVRDEGPTKENGANQIVATGTWTLSTTGEVISTTLTYTSNNATVNTEFTIKEISGSKLVASFTVAGAGTNFVQTQTFVHP